MQPTVTTEPSTTRRRRKSVPPPPLLSPIAQTVQGYIDGVLDGTVIAGELIRLAVQRQVDDLREGPSRGLRFDQEKAERVIEFFSYLKHSKGEWAGLPFTLEPWQQFQIWVIFGWLREDGTRRFRTVYDEEARKNGKSTKAAGVGLYMAFADGEPGAEVYSAATKKEQALIVHGEATRMVRATPNLANLIQIYKNNLSRVDRNQKYEPLGADEDTLDGLNVHCGIIDELHAHRNRGVYDVIATGTGARQQPLIFSITTAGTDQTEASISWELHCYAEQVLRGIVQDDQFFATIYAMDEGDNWQDERNWYKSNPNLGVSKKLDYMRDNARKAAKLPGFLNTFLRLELNRWTQQVTRWIDMLLWDANAGPPIDEESLRGRLCYGGLDLSSVSDLTAWVLLFPDPVVQDQVTILPRLWCPEARLHKEADEDAPDRRRNPYADQYQAWARDGWLMTTPGNAIDYDAVKAQILADAQMFQIQEVAVDRLFQGYQLSMQLADEGLTVAACGMGFMSMAGPCKEFERRLLEKRLHHGGHPVLKWMANNVAVREDPAGNLKPDKASSQGKIDGIIGILLALDRAMRHITTTSVYESRGLLTLGGPTDGETPGA
jgi:phage terminase large subunit-like protein